MVNYLYVCEVFNIINRKAINSYAMDYPDAAKALREWYHVFRLSTHTNWNELKAEFPRRVLWETIEWFSMSWAPSIVWWSELCLRSGWFRSNGLVPTQTIIVLM